MKKVKVIRDIYGHTPGTIIDLEDDAAEYAIDIKAVELIKPKAKKDGSKNNTNRK